MGSRIKPAAQCWCFFQKLPNRLRLPRRQIERPQWQGQGQLRRMQGQSKDRAWFQLLVELFIRWPQEDDRREENKLKYDFE
jgi:hypothetical protein